MTAPASAGHFVFPELSEELARIDRPWRHLWLLCALLGLIAGSIGALLLGSVWRSGSSRPVEWLGPSFLLACLAPSALGFWGLRHHPVPPTEAWISSDTVRLSGPGRPPVAFRWSELGHPLVVCDFRSTWPFWLSDGSARRIEYLLLRTPRTTRTPLPPEAVAALIRAAEQNGFTVQEMKDEKTPQGTVRCARILPPRHGRRGAFLRR